MSRAAHYVTGIHPQGTVITAGSSFPKRAPLIDPSIPVGPGTNYPVATGGAPLYDLSFRYKALQAVIDISVSSDGEPPFSFNKTVSLGAPGTDLENHWLPVFFASDDPDVTAQFGEFRQPLFRDGSYYIYCDFRINPVGGGLILTSEYKDVLVIPPEDIPTYPSGVVCETPFGTFPMFKPVLESTVSGTITVTVAPVNGYRPYNGPGGPAIDADTGARLLDPHPRDFSY